MTSRGASGIDGTCARVGTNTANTNTPTAATRRTVIGRMQPPATQNNTRMRDGPHLLRDAEAKQRGPRLDEAEPKEIVAARLSQIFRGLPDERLDGRRIGDAL